MNRLRFYLAWYDLWVGAYFDRLNRQLYICPLPCCVIQVDLQRYYAIMGRSVAFYDVVIGTVTGGTEDDLCYNERLVEISKEKWLEMRR